MKRSGWNEAEWEAFPKGEAFGAVKGIFINPVGDPLPCFALLRRIKLRFPADSRFHFLRFDDLCPHYKPVHCSKAVFISLIPAHEIKLEAFVFIRPLEQVAEQHPTG